MATFGNTSETYDDYRYAAANHMWLGKFAAPQAGVATSMSAYMRHSSSGSQAGRFVFYDDDGSGAYPGTPLGATEEFSVSGSTMTWYNPSFPSGIPFAAGDYWLGYWWGTITGSGYSRLCYATTGGTRVATDTSVDGPTYASTGLPPNPLDEWIIGSGSENVCIYLTYSVSASGIAIPLLNHLLLGD
jgi:hypothetical protein